MRRAFRNAVTRAKLPERLHQHDLRHRRVTTWLAEGRDVVLVKEAMGHSDLRTTMGYTHLAKEHLSALVEGFGPPCAEQTDRLIIFIAQPQQNELPFIFGQGTGPSRGHPDHGKSVEERIRILPRESVTDGREVQWPLRRD